MWGCACVQLVWVCLHGTDYGLPRHIVLLLRLARMRRVFTLIKVSAVLMHLPISPASATTCLTTKHGIFHEGQHRAGVPPHATALAAPEAHLGINGPGLHSQSQSLLSSLQLLYSAF